VGRTESGTFDRIAAPYDRGMAPLERLGLRAMRARLVPQAQGHVLELGVGTGANLPFYGPTARVMAIDESADMLGFAAQRGAARDGRLRLAQMDAEHLAFRDGTFDGVLASLVLCSVVDPARTLAEVRRVLRAPGGRLLLLEHMRPEMRPLSWLADLANVPWYAFNGRCHLNRRTQELVAQAGFEIEQVESHLGGLVRLLVARRV
jgi:ubiquinone/menaquinone biosynthesis C-methylase UbiE